MTGDEQKMYCEMIKTNIILDDIIGNITGYGDTNIDTKALYHLDLADKVVWLLLNNLCINARYKGYEGSCLDIRDRSREIIRECFGMLKKYYNGNIRRKRIVANSSRF